METIIELVKKAQKGDDKAFLKLFKMYEEEVYKVSYIYVKNQTDALDIVQETAYRSFKSIKHLKEPQYFKTWLIRIAINCCYDFVGKRMKSVDLKPDMFPVGFTEDIDLEIMLRDLIELLNEEEKSIIILRFYQDLTLNEVAKTLHMPLGTVKTILYKSLNKLRKEWKGEVSNGK